MKALRVAAAVVMGGLAALAMGVYLRADFAVALQAGAWLCAGVR